MNNQPDRDVVAKTDWVSRIRRVEGPGRNLLKEAWISLTATYAVSKDTSKTEHAFEAIENFPAVDLLRWNAKHLPILNDPIFIAMYAKRAIPDLSTEAALKMRALPSGTLGHEYAGFVARFGLDNAFLSYLVIDEPGKFLAYRIGHMHDLFHFILGYQPFETIGEMEVEAFLLAQTGAANHVLFLAGHLMYLMRNERRKFPAAMRRIRQAYADGKRAKNLILAGWETLFQRPLKDVKEELGIAHRPTWGLDVGRKVKSPELAHVVFNVPERSRVQRFYRELFDLEISATDPRLGVTFMTDGTDHHTLALQESWPLDPVGFVSALGKNAKRGLSLLKARNSGAVSASGQKTVVPPVNIIRAGMKTGMNHVGYRVETEADLKEYYLRLKASGIQVDWAVNHGDMMKGIYFRDPAGNYCEIFCDGDSVKAKQAQIKTGASVADMKVDDLFNFEMDPERDLS